MLARSYLFVPAHRPDRYGKALASGADAVIVDLEDAVGPDGKREARDAVVHWLAHATASELPEALDLVSEEAARLLVDEWGFSIEDAFIFLSVACDAGIAQGCKPAADFGTIARFSSRCRPLDVPP